MKAGCRPPYVGARRGVLPEYPVYWEVTPDIEAAVALLVKDGQVEYELHLARGPGGTFTGPAVQLAPVVPDGGARRGKGRG
jgi:hypothetical protein